MWNTRNCAGEDVLPGQIVDRLDNYKRNGKVLLINRDRGRRPVLVRWPNLNDEWCSPELLMPRATEGKADHG